MVAIYDDIKKLYELLASEHGNIKDVSATLKHLNEAHGVDRRFIETTFRTFAIEKMVTAVMESLEK